MPNRQFLECTIIKRFFQNQEELCFPENEQNLAESVGYFWRYTDLHAYIYIIYIYILYVVYWYVCWVSNSQPPVICWFRYLLPFSTFAERVGSLPEMSVRSEFWWMLSRINSFSQSFQYIFIKVSGSLSQIGFCWCSTPCNIWLEKQRWWRWWWWWWMTMTTMMIMMTMTRPGTTLIDVGLLQQGFPKTTPTCSRHGSFQTSWSTEPMSKKVAFIWWGPGFHMLSLYIPGPAHWVMFSLPIILPKIQWLSGVILVKKTRHICIYIYMLIERWTQFSSLRVDLVVQIGS